MAPKGEKETIIPKKGKFGLPAKNLLSKKNPREDTISQKNAGIEEESLSLMGLKFQKKINIGGGEKKSVS